MSRSLYLRQITDTNFTYQTFYLNLSFKVILKRQYNRLIIISVGGFYQHSKKH